MFRISESVNLDTNEEVVDIFRSHGLVLIKSIVAPLVLIFLLFLLLFPLFHAGPAGVIFFFCSLAVLCILIVRKLLMWSGSIYILTNHRLLAIHRKGFFKKHANQILLENINELSYDTKGFFQTFFHFGDIKIVMMTVSGHFILRNIASPQNVLDMISKRVAAVRKTMPTQPAQIIFKDTSPPEHHL